MERKLFLRSIGGLALVLCAVLMFGTTSSMATPLTEVKIGYGAPLGYNVTFGSPIGSVNPFTEYTFQAKGLPDIWGYEVFCVEAKYIDPNPVKFPEGPWEDYYLAPIKTGGNWDVAVKMADHYYINRHNGLGYKQSDYQMAIWYTLDVVVSEPPNTGNVASLLGINWEEYSPLNFKFALLDSQSSQTFMTAVPEPGTILLLGAGLIGLAGFRRFRKK